MVAEQVGSVIMDILVAGLIVLVAWLVFKSLTAVLIALLCVAVAIYIVRNLPSRRL